MTTPTLDTFLDIAAHLDFDLACQHHQHAATHATDDPAAWVIWTVCPWCQDRRNYLLCESGRLRMTHPRTLGCRPCGATGGWHDFVLILVPLGSKP